MNFKRIFFKVVVYALLLLLIFSSLYALFLRDLWVNKGITKTERNMEMPGDGYVNNPDMVYEQAITINTPPEYVWAYLIQVGYKRAGWYNWDFINRLAADNYFYENDRSADRVIPELQNLNQGDKISIVPDISFLVEEIKENDFNLNIPRYVDTFEEEEEIDLMAVQAERKEIEAEIATLNEQMDSYLKELGYGA
jgi:hypothetical protein